VVVAKVAGQSLFEAHTFFLAQRAFAALRAFVLRCFFAELLISCQSV
jgi:hypothetical protein